MRTKVLALLIVLLAPSFALAQSKPDSWDNLKQLQPGQKIELIDTKMKAVYGKFVGSNAQGITLQKITGETTVQRADVVRVSARDTSHRARNMMIGAAVGVGGGVFGSVLARVNCTNQSNCHDTNHAEAIALIGGLGGAGAAIGAIPNNYLTIYRAKKVTTP